MVEQRDLSGGLAPEAIGLREVLFVGNGSSLTGAELFPVLPIGARPSASDAGIRSARPRQPRRGSDRRSHPRA